MAKEITITVEDDVADWLEQQDDISAIVSKLMVRPMPPLPSLPRPRTDPKVLEELRKRMESRYTKEGLAEARRKIEEAKAKMTPELKEWSRKLFEDWGIRRCCDSPDA